MPTGGRGELGQYLWDIRQAAGKTLRQIEEASHVSNAYLSQIETGLIRRPSPQILYKLADAYGASYELLMEKAGHLRRQADVPGRASGRLPTFAKAHLDQDEEAELLKYLAFIRSRKGKK